MKTSAICWKYLHGNHRMVAESSKALDRREVEQLVREVLNQRLRGEIRPAGAGTVGDCVESKSGGPPQSAGRQCLRPAHARDAGASRDPLRRRLEAHQAQRPLPAGRIRLRAARHPRRPAAADHPERPHPRPDAQLHADRADATPTASTSASICRCASAAITKARPASRSSAPRARSRSTKASSAPSATSTCPPTTWPTTA